MKTLFLYLTVLSAMASAQEGKEAQINFVKGTGIYSHADGAKDVNGQGITDPSMSVDGFQPFKFGVQINDKDGSCWDIYHYNEGHAINNHRDGFGVTVCRRWKLGGGITVQGGVGPYLAMNTYSTGGVQYDRKEMGLLMSFAAEIALGRGFSLRGELNQTIMPGSFNGRTFMVGASYALGAPAERQSSEDNGLPADWVLLTGRAKTTATDGGFSTPIKLERNQELSAKYPGVIYSISILKEGNTGITDRTGVAGQIGYKFENQSGWSAGGQIGPMVSYEAQSQKVETSLMYTVFVEKKIGKTWFLRGEFNRNASSNNERANDSDNGLIGVGRRFH
jgi:hypothetical protein